MICSAHGRSSALEAGRKEKMILRLGVSETPVTLVGPITATSMIAGGVVVPALAVPFEALDQSVGRIKSSYGPSFRRTKATDTDFWPAFTKIGSLLMMSTPSGLSANDWVGLIPFS